MTSIKNDKKSVKSFIRCLKYNSCWNEFWNIADSIFLPFSFWFNDAIWAFFFKNFYYLVLKIINQKRKKIVNKSVNVITFYFINWMEAIANIFFISLSLKSLKSNNYRQQVTWVVIILSGIQCTTDNKDLQ